MITSRLLAAFEHGFGTRHCTHTQADMASLTQIHSNVTLVASAPGCVGEGDALVTSQTGVTLSIRTADCLPILLADPRTGSVAAVHAGWRGTAAEILRVTIERLQAEFAADPADLLAAIGPGIGRCCYQVGPEVARQLGAPLSARVDLAAINRHQLEQIGVLPGHIDVVSPCTYCEGDQFFSYRRDGESAGRMISFIRR